MAGHRLSGLLRGSQRLCGGMAGAGAGVVARTGPQDNVERGSRRPACIHGRGNGARKTLFASFARLISRHDRAGNCDRAHRLSLNVALAAMLLALLPGSVFATQVTSARVWPAQEYTRLTLE